MAYITVANGEVKRGRTSKIKRVLKCESTVVEVLFVFMNLKLLVEFEAYSGHVVEITDSLTISVLTAFGGGVHH